MTLTRLKAAALFSLSLVASAPASSYIKEGSAPGLSLTAFNTGSVRTFGRAVSSRRGWLSRATLDVPAFLIRHPRQGLILFDTGLHPDIATRPGKKMGRLNHLLVPFAQSPGQDLVSQLRIAGAAPEDVRWVVVSHLHLDHAGLVDAFPRATVVVDAREWGAQAERSARGKAFPNPDTRELAPRLKLRLVELSSAPAFGPFEHAEDLFGDGSLRLLDLSGHTPGSLGAWVELPGGPVLLAGDASFVVDNHALGALPIRADIHDVALYKSRLALLREAQELFPSLLILPGHDLSPLKNLGREDVAPIPFSR